MKSAKRLALATALSAGFCSAILSGCGGSSRLETGYQYTPLGASPAERRAFYAGPFSAEAREAQIERERGAQSGGQSVGRVKPGL